MQTKSEARMFLAGERYCAETETFRSHRTFNFGPYRQQGKEPFESLYVLNDETLAGGESAHFRIEEDTLVVLLPLVGGVSVGDQNNKAVFVEAGQVQLLFKQKGSSLSITNPYEGDLVNYLHLRFRYPALKEMEQTVFSFNIERSNQLIPLFPTINEKRFYLNAVIGKLKGREEAVYKLSSEKNVAMAFVVQGAFENENRLLEGRDGLALWNTAQVEMEALSNDAIILLLEMSQQP